MNKPTQQDVCAAQKLIRSQTEMLIKHQFDWAQTPEKEVVWVEMARRNGFLGLADELKQRIKHE